MIRVDEPRTAHSVFDDQPFDVPWTIMFGYNLTLRIPDTATLTRLRDAIDAKLAEHTGTPS